MAKKAPKEETRAAFDPTKAAAMLKEDLLPMQLAWKEMENAALKHQIAQTQVDKAAQVFEEAKALMSDMNTALNGKYGLDVGKDKISIEDGSITRA